MPSSCKEIREALAECLQNSECVMKQRHPAKDCLRPPLVDELPTKCQQLKHGYGECKRGMIDMRKRFRGNYPPGSRTPESRHMLYAGKPFGSKSTNTNTNDSAEEKSENSV